MLQNFLVSTDAAATTFVGEALSIVWLFKLAITGSRSRATESPDGVQEAIAS